MPPDRSSSRSVLVSSQLRSRETVRQISHQIDEELSRIASASPHKSISSRPYSSEAGAVSLKDAELISLPVADVLVGINTDLNRLQHSFCRAPSAPCNPSDSASRTATIVSPTVHRSSGLERPASQASSLPASQETIGNNKVSKHTLQTSPASNTSRRFASAQSDNSTKDGHTSAYTAINLQLETVTDVTSSFAGTPYPQSNKVVSMRPHLYRF